MYSMLFVKLGVFRGFNFYFRVYPLIRSWD
jgi:hypothetical protein